MAIPFEIPDTERTGLGKWGVSHTIAIALVALDLPIVSRSTLRNLLPAGKRTHHGGRPTADPRGVRIRGVGRTGRNTRRLIELGSEMTVEGGQNINEITKRFQDALARMEASGWLSRGREYVLVADKRSLLDWAMSAELPSSIDLSLQESLNALLAQPEKPVTDRAAEQRRRELMALKRLMEEGLGSKWSGKGSVRFVPRSSPYLPEKHGEQATSVTANNPSDGAP